MPTIPERRRTLSRRAPCIALATSLALSAPAAAQQVAARSLAAPPEELASGRLRLPDPSTVGSVGTAALLPAELRPTPDGMRRATVDLPLPRGEAAIVPLGLESEEWRLRLVSERGVLDLATSPRVLRRSAPLDPLVHGAGETVRHDVPIERSGMHRLEIVAPAEAGADAFVLVRDASPARLHAHFGSYAHGVGAEVEVHARLVGPFARVPGAAPAAEGAIAHAEAIVVAPDGRRTVVPLAPDAGTDGWSGAFAPAVAGSHRILVVAHGRDRLGEAVVRSAALVAPVSEASIAIAGAAHAAPDGDGTWAISIPVQGDAATRRVIVAAEVWARRADESVAAAAWIAGLRDAPSGEGAEALVLDLDLRWLSLGDLRPPIELREVRVHDADTLVPIARAARLAVDAPEVVAGPEVGARAGRLPDPAMLRGRPGRRTATLDAAHASVAAPGAHGLMLVHGYCSGGNPFPLGDFSGELAIFHDPAANRSNDAFAQLLLADGALLKSHGIVGHSQGGNAALHLYAFYWSALDWASGPRLVQGVGVPWQGTALAGNAAVLGEIFGFGCGVNDDLTYDGAAVWLSTIPGWARAEAYTWATTFEDAPLFYDYCNLITDLLLEDPEDGVVERWSTILPGGNDMGLVEGWCHTEGMRDPPQTQDHARNASLNSEAAR